MLRSLNTGVSGMRNHQVALDVLSSNIANVNTIGYKASRVVFSDQMSQAMSGAVAPGSNRGGSNGKQVGLGLSVGAIDTIQTQGTVETTGKVTDLAIQGDGFFILTDGPQRYYTRAGAFGFDSQGNLVNPSSGLKVLGWPTMQDSTGKVVINQNAPLQPVKVPTTAVFPPKATDALTLTGNLDVNLPVGNTNPDPAGVPTNRFSTTAEVYDSFGTAHLVQFNFDHDAVGKWSWSVAQGSDMPTAPVINAGPYGSDIQFDANGKLINQNPADSITKYDGGSVTITWNLPDGSTTTATIKPNFGDEGQTTGLMQFAGASTAVPTEQNGYAKGELKGLSINNQGVITGIFSNGLQQDLGQMAMATFTNPAGLAHDVGTNFLKTSNSGDAIIRAPGTADAGMISSGQLEMSNVDLADQFAKMISTQRGFQANSRVLTTSDEVLQELINLKR